MVYYMDIGKFYKAKTKYEEKELIALQRNKKPTCINCKNPVGMKFLVTPLKLQASCGAYNLHTGCDYRIQIIKEKYALIDDKLVAIDVEIAKIEEDIIIVKFNHLFKFTTSDQTRMEFEELKLRLVNLKEENTALLLKKYIPKYQLINDRKRELHRAIDEMKTMDSVSEIIDTQNTIIDKLNKVISDESYKHKEVVSSNNNLNHRLVTQIYTIESNEIKL